MKKIKKIKLLISFGEIFLHNQQWKLNLVFDILLLKNSPIQPCKKKKKELKQERKTN